MRVVPCLFVLSCLFASSLAWAQAWPTTDWHVVEQNGGHAVTGSRAAVANLHESTLSGASRWFRSLGFRPPRMTPDETGAYRGQLKPDTTDISSSTEGYYHNASLSILLSSRPDLASPADPVDRMMAPSGVHELFHAVTWGYPGYVAFINANNTEVPTCGTSGSDRFANAWFAEGAPGAFQIRWIERQTGSRYAHNYDAPSSASWLRYYDEPLHHSRLHAGAYNPAERASEKARNRSWRCGYGTWWFWYAAGEMLGETLDEKVQYLRYVLESNGDPSDGGLGYVDEGLKKAAKEFDSSFRYDEGLYEIYPAFIAEYADDKRFYRQPEPISLRGRSEVRWFQGIIDRAATQAFEVSINVDDNATQTSRFIVTLDPQENRDQLHLIAGQQVYGRPTSEEDPYSFTIPVLRDTTILVRLANVAKEAADTEKTQYTIRLELGGFYGAPAAGPYTAPDVDIPPGFNVLSGPPELVGCQSGPDGGSVFDLITAAEAVGDIRRAEDGANQTLADMDEALEDGEFPMPNATPQQRAAMKRMIESGAISQAQIAEMRAAIAEAQAEMRQNEPGIDQARSKMAREYQGRSRLIANFVGKAAGKTCQVILAAGLRGEEGGAQQLSTVDYANQPADGPLAVGIENVGYLVGDSQAEMMQSLGAEEAFSICMMTPEEQARDQRSSCPRGCSGGRLILEEASQGHARGTLRVDLIRQRDAGPNATCPQIDRRELVVGFNITSANSGQDADIFRGISDEMFRMMGVDQAGLDLFRGAMNGRMFR